METANIDSYVTVPLSSASGPRRSTESLRETRAELQPVWHDVGWLCAVPGLKVHDSAILQPPAQTLNSLSFSAFINLLC
jgi:hypothetical protein